MAKRIDEIPEIVTGSDMTETVLETAEEKAPAKKKARAAKVEVTRTFVANDYLNDAKPGDALYQDVREEYGDADPWSVMVTIKMGRKPAGEANTFMIRVNGRKYDLAYRQTHEVPLPIAIEWLYSMASNEIAEDMADAMTANYQKLATEKIL